MTETPIGETTIILEPDLSIVNAGAAMAITPVAERDPSIPLLEQLSEIAAQNENYNNVPSSYTVAPNPNAPDGPGTIVQTTHVGDYIGETHLGPKTEPSSSDDESSE